MKKFRVTTALSVAGVLAAGGAAYALNVNVLSSAGASHSAMSLQTPTAVTDPTSTPADGNVSVKEISSTSTTTTYQVGDAGTVMVDISSGKVVITSVVPNAGWTAEPARAGAMGSAKVHFVSGATRLEFVAAMVDGAPSVSVTVDDSPSTSGAPGINSTKPTMPGSSIGDDDDDDDDDEHHSDDEDHEDEDEDEDGPEFEHEDDD